MIMITFTHKLITQWNALDAARSVKIFEGLYFIYKVAANWWQWWDVDSFYFQSVSELALGHW